MLLQHNLALMCELMPMIVHVYVHAQVYTKARRPIKVLMPVRLNTAHCVPEEGMH